jgi:hypothetical protein
MTPAQREAHLAYNRAYQAARYERAKAAGLCLQCKKAPRPNGKNFCEACCRMKSRRLRAWNRRQRRAKGIPTRCCSICRDPGHNITTCPDRPGERCRVCKLLLPCGGCPSAVAAAERRVAWD